MVETGSNDINKMGPGPIFLKSYLYIKGGLDESNPYKKIKSPSKIERWA